MQNKQKNSVSWCLSGSKLKPPHPILNIVLQTKPADPDYQDYQAHQDDQDYQDDQDDQDDQGD